MKIIKSRFGKKKVVINSRGKRVTEKYSEVCEYEYGTFCLYDCYCDGELKATYVFDKSSEKRIPIGYIEAHKKVNDKVFALKISLLWHFYDMQGNLLREDVSYFEKCKIYPYIIAVIEGNDYLLDEKLQIISEPFISISDFNEFGYSVVRKSSDERYSILSVNKGEFSLVPWEIECDGLTPLSKKHIAVKIKYRYGVIDMDGKFIIPVMYDEVQCKGDNHIQLKYKGRYGLADITGKIIFECFYDRIMETTDKFAVKDFSRLETSKVIEITKN